MTILKSDCRREPHTKEVPVPVRPNGQPSYRKKLNNSDLSVKRLGL
jgi:hypothetical protein